MTPAGKKSPMRVLYVRARPSRNFGKFPLQNLHNEAWISISSVLINISLFFPRNCTLPWVRQRIFLDIKIFGMLLSRSSYGESDNLPCVSKVIAHSQST